MPKLEEAIIKLEKEVKRRRDEMTIKKSLFDVLCNRLGKLSGVANEKSKSVQRTAFVGTKYDEQGKNEGQPSKLEIIPKFAKCYQSYHDDGIAKAEKIAAKTFYFLQSRYKINDIIIDNTCGLIDVFVRDIGFNKDMGAVYGLVGKILNAAYLCNIPTKSALSIAESYYTTPDRADVRRTAAKHVKNATVNTLKYMSKSRTDLEDVLSLIRKYRRSDSDSNWREHGSYLKINQICKAVCRTMVR